MTKKLLSEEMRARTFDPYTCEPTEVMPFVWKVDAEQMMDWIPRVKALEERNRRLESAIRMGANAIPLVIEKWSKKESHYWLASHLRILAEELEAVASAKQPQESTEA